MLDALFMFLGFRYLFSRDRTYCEAAAILEGLEFAEGVPHVLIEIDSKLLIDTVNKDSQRIFLLIRDIHARMYSMTLVIRICSVDAMVSDGSGWNTCKIT